MPLDTNTLVELKQALNEFAENTRWWRKLTPFEKRVKLSEIQNTVVTNEETYVETLAEILKGSLKRIVSSVKSIMNGESIADLKDLRVGYHDKMVNVVRENLVKMYLYGKQSVYEEVGKTDAVVSRTNKMMLWYRVKAEAIVTELEGKLKARALYIVLEGIRRNRNEKEIISQIIGLSDGYYNPEFERKHPRAEGGRFGNKPKTEQGRYVRNILEDLPEEDFDGLGSIIPDVTPNETKEKGYWGYYRHRKGESPAEIHTPEPEYDDYFVESTTHEVGHNSYQRYQDAYDAPYQDWIRYIGDKYDSKDLYKAQEAGYDPYNEKFAECYAAYNLMKQGWTWDDMHVGKKANKAYEIDEDDVKFFASNFMNDTDFETLSDIEKHHDMSPDFFALKRGQDNASTGLYKYQIDDEQANADNFYEIVSDFGPEMSSDDLLSWRRYLRWRWPERNWEEDENDIVNAVLGGGRGFSSDENEINNFIRIMQMPVSNFELSESIRSIYEYVYGRRVRLIDHSKSQIALKEPRSTIQLQDLFDGKIGSLIDIIKNFLIGSAGVQVMSAVNEGRLDGFDELKNEIGAYQWSAILDNKTCSICRPDGEDGGLDGKYFSPDDPLLDMIWAPIHANCRCILVGVLKDELKNYPVEITRLNYSDVKKWTKNKFWLTF